MLPPLYKLDNPIEYVSPRDLAWDIDKRDKECEGMAPDEKSEHPWYEYQLGLTRYDLSLAREYFKEGEKPVVFTLKRLTRHDWMQARTISAGSEELARNYALYRGLERVTAGDENVPLVGPQGKRKMLSDSDAAMLEKKFGREMMSEVGSAILIASGDLTEREKKQSD